MQINLADRNRPYATTMARYDWTYRLSIAATLAFAAGAICILLFAM